MINKIYATKPEYFGITPPQEDDKITISLTTKNIHIKSRNIEVSGHVSGVDKVIELLYYNKINSIGTIVSTLVGIGKPHDSNTTQVLEFTPFSMFDSRYNMNNIVGEDGCISDYSFYNTIRDVGNSGIDDSIMYTKLSTKDLANKVKSTIVVDGWYTMISAGIASDITGLSDGAIVDISGNLNIINDGSPVPIFTPTIDSVDVFSRYVTSGEADKQTMFPQFIRQDMFILNRFYYMYSDKIKKNNDNITKLLRLNDRAINVAASVGNFKYSQLLLQYMQSIQIRFVNY